MQRRRGGQAFHLRPGAGRQRVGEAEEYRILQVTALAQQVRAEGRRFTVTGQHITEYRELVAVYPIQHRRARRHALAGALVVVHKQPVIHMQPRQDAVGFRRRGNEHHFGDGADQPHRGQPFDTQANQAGLGPVFGARGRDRRGKQKTPSQVVKRRRIIAGGELRQQAQQVRAFRAGPHNHPQAAHRRVEDATGIRVQFLQLADLDAEISLILDGRGIDRFAGQGGRRRVQRRRRVLGCQGERTAVRRFLRKGRADGKSQRKREGQCQAPISEGNASHQVPSLSCSSARARPRTQAQ